MTLRHGYFYDQGYTYGAYSESSPERLAFVALLSSHRPPRLDAPFRCLELGCGQGLGLCLQAANYPQADFLGIDFKAEHIAHGRSLAAEGGLENVRFELADLLAIEASPPSGWGEFDLVIAHGVLGWVSPEVGARVLSSAAAALRPGGLFYVSYNCQPGWLAALPFQHAVKGFQGRCGDGKPSLDAALQLFDQLREAGALVFQSQPALAGRLDNLSGNDPAYLLHEYNHSQWKPQFVDDVIRQAADVDLHYVGSASLPEGFQGLLPEPFRAVVMQQNDHDQRELVRDLLTNQSFRRDIYAKGRDPLWSQDVSESIQNLQLIFLRDTHPGDPEDLFTFRLSCGEVRGNDQWFHTFLDLVKQGPCTIGSLLQHRDAVGATTPLPELLQNISLLVHKGLVAFAPPGRDPHPAQRFNRHLAARVLGGGPYRAIALPAAGNIMSLNDTQMLMLHASFEGRSGDALLDVLQDGLERLGRRLQKDGRQLEGEAFRAELVELSQQFESETLPLLRRLQAIG
ncbi:MAG: class I SAM-dependent methyltransferase [Synechococcaceae cyanobacterium]|nr:class I SAM-dependent methyltransferase [Synechococcaceae cyanobacterium]